MTPRFWCLLCLAAGRRPPRMYVKELATRPAIGEEEAAYWGIQDGFEGGRFLRTADGLYHCFPSERMRRGTGQGNGSLPSVAWRVKSLRSRSHAHIRCIYYIIYKTYRS